MGAHAVSAKRFHATVSDTGKLQPEDAAAWAGALAALRGQRVVVTVERPQSVRSKRANAYWWAVIVPFFQEVWSAGRVAASLPPYDKEQAHEVLVQVLAGYEDGPLPGTRVRKLTRDMFTREFAQLVDGARALAREQYGSVIPLPGERWEEE